MSIILPATITTNSAPAESRASVTVSVQSVGRPRSLGLSESDDCVLAMHTGKCPKPRLLDVEPETLLGGQIDVEQAAVKTVHSSTSRIRGKNQKLVA